MVFSGSNPIWGAENRTQSGPYFLLFVLMRNNFGSNFPLCGMKAEEQRDEQSNPEIGFLASDFDILQTMTRVKKLFGMSIEIHDKGGQFIGVI